MIRRLSGVTVGVKDASRSLQFYGELLGFTLRDDSTDYLGELKDVIGALLEARLVSLNNKDGGPLLQLIEHTSTKPIERDKPAQWGDIGYLELGLRAYRLEELYLDLKSRGADFMTPVRSMEGPDGERISYAYLRDPDGLPLQLVEGQGGYKPRAGGICHVGLGVSDLEQAIAFYRDLLGLDHTVYEFAGRLPELDDLAGGKEIRLIFLERSARETGAPPQTTACVKLIHAPGRKGDSVLQARRWGDIGISEMAFEVEGLDEMVNFALERGIELFNLPMRTTRDGSDSLFVYLVSPDEGIIRLAEARPVSAPRSGSIKRVLDRLKGPGAAGAP